MPVYDCDFTAFLFPVFVVIVIYTRTLYVGVNPPQKSTYFKRRAMYSNITWFTPLI